MSISKQEVKEQTGTENKHIGEYWEILDSLEESDLALEKANCLLDELLNAYSTGKEVSEENEDLSLDWAYSHSKIIMKLEIISDYIVSASRAAKKGIYTHTEGRNE